jgi:hypothetical protein
MQYVRLLHSYVSWALLSHRLKVPVVRAADYATPGTGRIRLSPDDPCTVWGEGTKFLLELTPRMQIMLPKCVGSPVAEVTQVISDTELKVKRVFGGETGKVTSRIREKTDELRIQGVDGMDFKCLPFVDQQEAFRLVYQRLTEGKYIGIFPEGLCISPLSAVQLADPVKAAATTAPIFFLSKLAYLSWH